MRRASEGKLGNGNMASTLETVTNMLAETKRRQTPTALREFLRAQFPPRKRGWPWRRSLEQLSYEVSTIELLEDAGFFRACCVFQVTAFERILEGSLIPFGGTFGLFALGAGGFSYLHHRKENLEAVFREEGRPLEEFAPVVLASLLAEALGRKCNSSHDVLRSAEHLVKYNEGTLEACKVNPRELERFRSSLVPPTVVGNAKTGWKVEFVSVFGWMHLKQKLIRHRYRFDPDFRIEYEHQILSRKIFKSVPTIMY